MRDYNGLDIAAVLKFVVAGLYIEQFCLAVLFFLRIADNATFAVGGVLMLVLMGLTVLAQLLLQRSFTRKLYI